MSTKSGLRPGGVAISIFGLAVNCSLTRIIDSETILLYNKYKIGILPPHRSKISLPHQCKPRSLTSLSIPLESGYLLGPGALSTRVLGLIPGRTFAP